MKLSNLIALYQMSPHWLVELSPSSRRIYIQNMKHFAHWMDRDINTITRPMIIDLKDALYEKPATCRLTMATLNNVLGFGHDKGLCKYNHATAMRHMPASKPIPRWTDEDIELFLEGCAGHLRAAILMALYTGQRVSDLSRMRWDQYDGQYIKVLQQKTIKAGKALRIPIHPELRTVLEELKKERINLRVDKRKTMVPSPYILHNSFHQPWSASSLSEAITRRCKYVGIQKSIHGIRKTTASKLAEAGCTPHLIAAITGHASLQEIVRYTQEADQARMAEQAIGKWIAGSGVPAT